MTGCGLAFCTSGIIVPIVQIIFPNIRWSYLVYGGLNILVFIVVFLSPDSYKDKQMREECEKIVEEEVPVHFRVDYLCALLLFFNNGAGESVTFYLETYVKDTEVINPDYAAYIYILFFGSVALGCLIASYFQQFISNSMLVPIHAWILGLQFVSLVIICLFNDSGTILWLCIALFGLLNAPSIAYGYDVCNRYAYPTVASSAILNVGLNLGVSVVPYFAAWSWEYIFGAIGLFYIASLAAICALPVLIVVPFNSYITSMNPLLSHKYTPVGNDDDDA